MESTEIPLVDLPVGVRFRPTEEELVNHYLKLKILSDKKVKQIIPEVDDMRQKEHFRFEENFGFQKRQSPKNAQTKWVLHEYHIYADLMDNALNNQKNSKTKKAKKDVSIMPLEGNRSSCHTPNEVNQTIFFIMPQEGSRSICTHLMKSITQESLKENVQQLPAPILSADCNSLGFDFSASPWPSSATGEQLTNDPLYQDLESYFADNEPLGEIFGMLNSYG
ncbi:hypothetical protein ACJRO7_036052 [Eucalyptus globulus]|uniref:NAC domain-containing protein n=1 Tax=Eucalyptus globulus TaxID=34317 RepID=A0ABD3JAJ2_EUCGL